MATTSAGPSEVRQPSAIVLVNGVQVPWKEWEVTNNGFYRADTFSVTLPVSSLPKGSQVSDLADASPINVEIRASVDGSSPTSLITGVVVDFEVSWRAGTLTMSGRDHTGDFIDAKTAEKFQNQTASQIVTTLAGRHGLSADVQATSTLAGRYYEIDHDRLTDETTEWDLITYLAQKEGYYAWVTGTTLHFKPASLVQGTPINVQYTAPGVGQLPSGAFVEMHTRRNLTLAADVHVIVWSWNHKQKTQFKVTAQGKKTGKGASSAPPQVYTYRVPGLTRDQAQQWAQNKLEEISRHERTLEIEEPMDVTLTPRNQIQLSGTGTSFDQLYWIDQVTRRFAFEEATQTVQAKNHSPQSTVSV